MGGLAGSVGGMMGGLGSYGSSGKLGFMPGDSGGAGSLSNFYSPSSQSSWGNGLNQPLYWNGAGGVGQDSMGGVPNQTAQPQQPSNPYAFSQTTAPQFYNGYFEKPDNTWSMDRVAQYDSTRNGTLGAGVDYYHLPDASEYKTDPNVTLPGSSGGLGALGYNTGFVPQSRGGSPVPAPQQMGGVQQALMQRLMDMMGGSMPGQMWGGQRQWSPSQNATQNAQGRPFQPNWVWGGQQRPGQQDPSQTGLGSLGVNPIAMRNAAYAAQRSGGVM